MCTSACYVYILLGATPAEKEVTRSHARSELVVASTGDWSSMST